MILVRKDIQMVADLSFVVVDPGFEVSGVPPEAEHLKPAILRSLKVKIILSNY
jgi:hypothetical protein